MDRKDCDFQNSVGSDSVSSLSTSTLALRSTPSGTGPHNLPSEQNFLGAQAVAQTG